MRILLLTQFFWPEARTAPANLAALAEDLTVLGHEVLVVTGFPNHPFGRIYDGYRMQPWHWETARGFRILRLPLYPDHSRSAVRRLLNYGSFMLSAATLGLWHSRRFQADVVLAYYAPPTMGWIANSFRKRNKAPLVYWITDMWPENFRAAGLKINDRFYKQLRRLEDWSYKQADVICVDSPGYHSNLIGKGVAANKIEVITEWADDTLFFPVDRATTLGEQFGLAGKFNVIYGGNLGQVQHLDAAIKAACLLRDLEDFQMVFIGDGNDLMHLQAVTGEYGAENVKFIAHQPMNEMRNFFAWADVLLVHLQRSPIFELQLPSKVLAYMACSRPILAAVSGTVAKIVQEAQAGLCCPPENPQAMAEQIRTFYAMSQSERDRMGEHGRQAYLHKYSRQTQVKRLETVLSTLVNRRLMPEREQIS